MKVLVYGAGVIGGLRAEMPQWEALRLIYGGAR